MEVNFKSDSKIVLKPLKKFIENRVSEIRNLVKMQQWRYCPTDMNRVDLPTRGTVAAKIMDNKFWTNGPEWITNESNWPEWSGNTLAMLTSMSDDEELQEESTLSLSTNTADIGTHQIIDLTQHSRLKKLLRITA